MRRLTVCLIVLIIFALGINVYSNSIRPFLRTGNWYPKNPVQLKELVDTLLNRTKKRNVNGRIGGIIVPHAGFEYSGRCAASAYKLLEPDNVDRVIILGVAHRSNFSGAVLTDFSYYSTPLGKIKVDMRVMRKLKNRPGFFIDDRISVSEHSLENQLPFIQRVLKGKNYKIVPVLFGYLKKSDFSSMAKIIGQYVNKRTLIIASSDFTHYGKSYGFVPFRVNIAENLKKLDMGMIDLILSLKFKDYFEYKKRTGITMCGFAPVGIMMNIFRSRGYSGHLSDYYRSADKTGNYSLSVSYASIVFTKKKRMKKSEYLSHSDKLVLIKIAKYSISEYLKNKNIPSLEEKFNITDNMRKNLGVFVTLKKNGRLRGCIGSIVRVEPLFSAVSSNAVNSAFKDPRFSPVKKRELNKLHVEISVITPLRKVDNYKDIRLGRDGVVLKKGYYRSVYLPQVATETGWTIDEFLFNLSRKAGLPGGAYKMKETEFYIFQAEVFGDDNLAK